MNRTPASLWRLMAASREVLKPPPPLQKRQSQAQTPRGAASHAVGCHGFQPVLCLHVLLLAYVPYLALVLRFLLFQTLLRIRDVAPTLVIAALTQACSTPVADLQLCCWTQSALTSYWRLPPY